MLQLRRFHVTGKCKATQIHNLNDCSGRAGATDVLFGQRMTQAIGAWVTNYYENVDL